MSVLQAPIAVLICLIVLCLCGTAQNQRPISGRNVNMVSGTSWPGGDPFLQRQNEPSLAVSTRNPLHILGGANDYRTVDIPFDPDPDDEKKGDSWLGLFKSTDGGNSWTSTLLSGYPQDTSRAGLESPIRGYQAAADPLVRAGTNGLFYYSGVAFNRTDQASSVFVARFIDNNNKESGDSISYIDTRVIAKQKKNLILDKPWIAVDIPRKDGGKNDDKNGNRNDEKNDDKNDDRNDDKNGDKCEIPQTKVGDTTVPRQSFAGGTVYLAYSAFDSDSGGGSKIMAVHSNDCGESWSDGLRLSDPKTLNQAANIAIDPNTGTVYVAWRQFRPATTSGLPQRPDAIYISRSTDGGKRFSPPVKAADILPFDQPLLPNTSYANFRAFRTNSYPTIATDVNADPTKPGRVYVAVASRAGGKTQNTYESRIVLYTSRDGSMTWSPQPLIVDAVDDKGNLIHGHQFMPSMTFAGGKLMLMYYDSRNDQWQGANDYIVDPAAYPTVWHNIDVRVAEASPADIPVFYSSPVSKYHFGVFGTGSAKQRAQLEFNRSNFPLFSQGTTPFMGDYADLVPAPPFVLKNGRWVYNTDSSGSPVYHAAWTDNRDVKPPAGPAYDWTKYHPPNSPALGPVSIFDGKTAVQACTPTDPLTPGMRNQNIYTSRITQGLVVTAPGNSKPLGRIQRAFVVVARNTSPAQKTFKLSIVNQPRGGQASFLQFQKVTDIWAQIPKNSSIARTVFASSTDPHASITVQVTEVTDINSNTIVPNGSSTSLTLNPDILNPDILNPDILNPDILNPDILNAEVYNPSISTNIQNPDILNPDILNPDILNPDILNPDILNPDILNPDILNPDILNPDILNPDILNPDILNPSVPNRTTNPNAKVTDLTWTVTNKGNTASAYSFKTLLSRKPDGLAFQLLVYRVYSTPDSVNCSLTPQTHQELVTNIENPDILNPDILNPDILNPNVSNATFAVAPGETSKVILRVVNPDTSRYSDVTVPPDGSVSNIRIGNASVNAAATATAVNTQDVANGITQPPVSTSVLTITSTRTLPIGFTGQAYSFTLMASGNNGAVTWSNPTALPPGLTLNPTTGVISGTPTQAGSFSFQIQAQDSVTTTSDVFTMPVEVPGVPSLASATQPDPCFTPQAGCVRAGTAITPSILVKALDGSGRPVAGVSIRVSFGTASTNATLGGTTTQVTGSTGFAAFSDLVINLPGTYTLKAAATGSALAFSSALTASFNVLPALSITPAPPPDGVVGRSYSATFTATGGIPPLTWTEVNPDGPPLATGQTFLPPGLSLNSSGLLSGTPTAAGTYNFTLRVTDSVFPQQTDKRTVALRISNPVTIQDQTLPNAAVGTAYTQYLTITGGVTAYVCTAVWAPANPGGITLSYSSSANTCFFSGTPATAGDYSVTVTATDSSSPAQTASKTLPLHIAALLQIATSSPLQAATRTAAYTVPLTAAGGTAPFTWSSDPLPPGLSLNSSSGVLSGTPAQSGQFAFNVYVTDSGGPQQSRQLAKKSFTLSVVDPPLAITGTPPLVDAVRGVPYARALTATGGSGTYTWTIDSGTLPAGLTVSGATISGTATTTGLFSSTLRVTDTGNPPQTAIAPLTIRVSDQLTITTTSPLPSGIVGVAYSTTLTNSGGVPPITWSIISGSLPQGLTLTTSGGSAGLISGVPAVGSAGTATFTVQAMDSGVPQTIRQQFQLYIAPFTVTGPDLGTRAIGIVQIPLIAQGGTAPYTWTLAGGSLPPGLLLSTRVPSPFASSTGIIGVATTPGTYNFSLTAADARNATVTQSYTLAITSFVETDLGNFPDGFVGNPYAYTFTAANNPGPVTWALANGSTPLPAGLSIVGNQITGTPTAAGTYGFTVTATASSGGVGVTIARDHTLTISPINVTSNPMLPNATVNSAYSTTLTASGGTAPYSWTLNGSLPSGLTMTASGVISGIPANPGTGRFPVLVTDSAGNSYTKNLAITVIGIPQVLPRILTTVLNDFTLGQPLSQRVNVNTGTAPYTWTASGLPPGLSLRTGAAARANVYPSDVEIGGVAWTLGDYPFTISVTDSSSPPITISRQFTLHVSPLSHDFPSDGALGVAYSFWFRPYGGTSPWTVVLSAGTLPAGLTVTSAGTSSGLISGTPRESGDFSPRFTISDSSGAVLNRTVSLSINSAGSGTVSVNTFNILPDALQGQAYSFTLSASGASGLIWSIDPASTLPQGLTLSSGGVLSGIPTVNGTTNFFIRTSDSANPNNYAVTQFTLTVTPLQLTFNTRLPNATIGIPYSANLTSAGGTPPYTWTVVPGSAFPEGLAIFGNTLTGTPTANAGGRYLINVVLSDGAGNVRHATLDLAVYRTTAPPLITTFSDLGTSSIGDVQIELDAIGNGGPYTWSLVQGALPPGLTLRTDLPPFFSPRASAGIIGVTNSPGSYSFILQVTDASTGQSTPQLFSLNITSLKKRDPFGLPDAFAAVPYSYAFSSTGTNVQWQVNTNTLPPGLSMSSAGVLSGTPTQAGTYTINFTLISATASVGGSASLLVSPIQITTPGALPSATQGQAYTQQFTASPASSNYLWTASSMPVGMSLSYSGLLSGTPVFPGNFFFNVTVTNSATQKSYTKSFALNILGVPPILPSLSTSDVNDFTVGMPVSWEFRVNGGKAPFTWSATGLPPGLELRTANVSPYVHPYNAELWGVPTQPGTFNATLSVTDSSSPPVTVSQAYSITTVMLDNDFPPPGARGVAYSFYLRTIGGAGAGYFWTNPPRVGTRLPAGLSLDPATGVVSGTPLEDGFFFPRFVFSDGTNTMRRVIGFTIASGAGTAATSANIGNDYSVQLPAATLNSFYSFTLTAGGAPSFTWTVLNDSTHTSTVPPGLSLSSSGVLSGTPTAAGSYTFFVKAADSSNSNNYSVREFSITVTPLVVNRSLPFGTVGNSYSTTISISGGTAPYTISLEQQSLLPPGLSLNNGVISGTPTSSGQYNFNLVLSDSSVPSNSVLENFNIAIYPAGGAPVIQTGPNLGTYTLGDVQIELRADGGGGPYVWSALQGSTLPPGLRLRTDGPPWFSSPGSTGLIGVATTPGSYSFTLQVASQGGAGHTSSQTFNLNITGFEARDFWILPDAFAGVPYSYAFRSTSTGTVHWQVQPGRQLPAGLTLSDAGVLSGTPTAPGNYSINFILSDGTSTVYRSSSLLVSSIQITTAGALPNGLQGQPYTPIQFNASPPSGNYQWTASFLPSGMSLGSGGVLSGTPQPAGNFFFSVTVTDSTAQKSTTKSFALNIVGSPALLPSLTNGPLSDFTLGQPQSFELYVNGGTAPFTWTAQGLPPGMELHTGDNVTPYVHPFNAELWGTPTRAGTYNMTFSVTDSSTPPITVSQTYTTHVVGLDNDFPQNGTRGVPYSFYLRTIGGQASSYSWAITSGRLPAGLALNASTGVISGTPLEDGFFNPRFAITNGSDTLNRSIGLFIGASNTTVSINNYDPLPDATLNQPYSYTFNASGAASIVWTVLSDSTYNSAVPTGMSLSSGGAFSGTPTAAGLYSFFIKAADAGNANNYSIRQFTINVTPLSVAVTHNLPSATVGTAYSVTLGPISGGTPPYFWTVAPDSAPLPPGLSLNNGVISGTPTSAGQYNFNLILRDSSVPTISMRKGFAVSIYPTGSQTYDAAAAFEQGWTSQSNPNGVWSYGFSSGFATPVTLYNQTAQPGVNGPNAQYWLSTAVNIGESPAAEFNHGPAYDDGNINFLANEFVLVAGIGGQYSDLVFTAPASGTYAIAAIFRGDQYGIGTVVGVVVNGNVIFSSSVTSEGQTVPFNTQVSLSAGQTLVFSVGPGGGSQNTGLSVTITAMPH